MMAYLKENVPTSVVTSQDESVKIKKSSTLGSSFECSCIRIIKLYIDAAELLSAFGRNTIRFCAYSYHS